MRRTLDPATTRKWKRRLLRFTVRGLLELYVVGNLIFVFLATVLARCTIEYHVVDAVTGVPVLAEIDVGGAKGRLRTNAQGSVTDERVMAVTPFWVFPRVFWFQVRHPVRVRATGYTEQEVKLGEQLDGLWLRHPRGVVTIRLQR